MKKFTFRLDRVLDWRLSHLRMAEEEMERLNSLRTSLAAQKVALTENRSRIQAEFCSPDTAAGQEFQALDRFLNHINMEQQRIDLSSAVLSGKIKSQDETVALHRRNVRLLEKLKEKGLATWTHDLDREIQRQAEDTYLARWKAK